VQNPPGGTRPKYARRDEYGGCPDIRFAPTGFYRLEKADRWWLVTPRGNAFLSFGVNHVVPGLLQRRENRDYWAKEYNLRDPDDPDAWLPHFRDKVRTDLHAFGFNTLGCHSDTRHYEPGFAPYVHTLRFVDICHWMTPTEEDFLDVFAESFVRHCDRLAREGALPRRDDPSLVAYSFTDCPVFTDLDAAPRGVMVYGASRIGLPTWPRVLRNLGAEAPGKRAYVECVREIYGDDVRAFNAAYGTDFASFDALRSARRWRLAVDSVNADEIHDNARFLERVVGRYYTVTTRAIRAHDPNHLIFGDKLNGNTGVPDSLIALAGQHVDLLFYQFYATYEDQEAAMDRWSALTGKALLNGDSSYSVPDEMMPCPLGPHSPDQEGRARRSLAFAQRSFSRPDFVGWHHCGWMDSWKTYPGQEERQHSGLQDPYGRYYRPMVETLSRFSAGMYDVAKP
jgi:agarase